MSQRPTPPGKTICIVCGAEPADELRQAESPSSSAVRPNKRADGWANSLLTGAIDELQALFAVEGKDGDVDLGHDGAQQRGCFHRAESLFAQCLAQVVHFEHHFAERVAGERAAAANRVVAFANGGKNVGECLQRTDDARLEIERDAEPQQDQQQIDGPLHLGGVAVVPEQERTQSDRRETRRQREQSDPPFEFQTMPRLQFGIERGE